MKKGKKLLSIVLSSAIFATLAGCGNTEPAADTASSSSVAAAEEAATEDASEAKTEDKKYSKEWDGDITNIKILLYDLRGTGDKSEEVVKKMNEITEKTIGVHADITWAATANYANTANLALSSGEQLDLMTVMPMDPVSFNALIANNQLMDISDIMEEEAPETMAEMGDYLSGMSVNGKIYGIPCWRNYASAIYLIMRNDVLEQVGMLDKAKNMTKWSEAEEIWKAVKDQTDFAPLGSYRSQAGMMANKDSFAEAKPWDTLGDVYTLVFTDDQGNVSLTLDNPDFLSMLKEQQRYWDEGLVYKDVLTNQDHVDTLTKAGVVFSSIQTSEMGVETAKKEATGIDETCIEVMKNMVGSSYVNKFGMAVPVTAQEPEAAVRWVNAVWTNPELENLLVWGVEGSDYINKDGVAAYPSAEAENSVYHNADFVYGNYFNALPWEGNDVDFRQQAMDYLKSATISPLMGFTPNTSELTNTMTAISTVYQKYYKQVLFGAASDEDIDNYRSELKTAGIDEYINTLQKQLTEWKEVTGK